MGYRKIDPTAEGFGPIDEDIFAWAPERRAKMKTLPTSLNESLESLKTDYQFLLAGDVFSKEFIDAWIHQKLSEANDVAIRPHPYEVELYYDI
jgi:glutamine synthetase